MGYLSKRNMVEVVAILMLASFLQPAYMRPLKNEEYQQGFGLLLQSLQKGPVRGSGPNPCTNIPGRNRGTCTSAVTAMNVAGNVFSRQPPPLLDSRLVVSEESGRPQSQSA
ncbi:hypothetical protein LINPERPRIM_LOCUS21298 [Linum perenne]